MAITTLLKINGVDYTGSILTPFRVEKNKLWGDDTGRVMTGEMKGTLVGIFPKVIVEFYPKSELELSQLLTVLDTAFQTVEYYDAVTRGLVTMGTYTNDYAYEIINLNPYYSEITVSFIATKKE